MMQISRCVDNGRIAADSCHHSEVVICIRRLLDNVIKLLTRLVVARPRVFAFV